MARKNEGLGEQLAGAKIAREASLLAELESEPMDCELEENSEPTAPPRVVPAMLKPGVEDTESSETPSETPPQSRAGKSNGRRDGHRELSNLNRE